MLQPSFSLMSWTPLHQNEKRLDIGLVGTEGLSNPIICLTFIHLLSIKQGLHHSNAFKFEMMLLFGRTCIIGMIELVLL